METSPQGVGFEEKVEAPDAETGAKDSTIDGSTTDLDHSVSESALVQLQSIFKKHTELDVNAIQEFDSNLSYPYALVLRTKPKDIDKSEVTKTISAKLRRLQLKVIRSVISAGLDIAILRDTPDTDEMNRIVVLLGTSNKDILLQEHRRQSVCYLPPSHTFFFWLTFFLERTLS